MAFKAVIAPFIGIAVKEHDTSMIILIFAILTICEFVIHVRNVPVMFFIDASWTTHHEQHSTVFIEGTFILNPAHFADAFYIPATIVCIMSSIGSRLSAEYSALLSHSLRQSQTDWRRI